MKQKISKGEIYYANLNGTIGSEQSGARPVIVAQNDIGNKHSPTVIIVPLTGKIENEIAQPTHYSLKPFGKLKYESIVLAEQIRAIDKRRLRNYWGKLSSKQIEKLDKCLSIALGIN